MGYDNARAEARAAEIARRTREARRVLIAKSAPTAVPFNIINGAILAAFFFPHVSTPLLASWFTLICLAAGARLAVINPARRSGTPPSPKVMRLYAALSGVVGACWGAAPFLLPAGVPLETVMITVFLIAGMTAGAALTSAAVVGLTSAYNAPALSLLSVFFALQGAPVYWVMGALTLVYFFIMRRLARTYAGTLGHAVTANVHLEEARRESEAQSLALSRLADQHEAAARAAERQVAANAAMLANMSHELGAPLNGVLGLTELLASRGLGEEEARLVRGVRQSGEQLHALIGDILDVSRIDAGRLDLVVDDVTARELGEASEAAISPSARAKGLAFEVQYEGDADKALRADKARILQMIGVYLRNAVRFTETGGVTLLLGVAEEGERVRLSARVRDTGCGVPESARAQLFDAFSASGMDPAIREAGTGLGLTLVDRLARLMGGRASYEPAETGSVFAFELVTKASARSDRYSAGETYNPSARRLRVLVAETDNTRSSVLLGYLKSFNCVVTCVTDSVALEEALGASAYDALVFGLSLSDCDPETASANVRGLASTACMTPILALDEELDAPVRAAGQETRVRAPITAEVLLEGLRTALAADPSAAASLRDIAC